MGSGQGDQRYGTQVYGQDFASRSFDDDRSSGGYGGQRQPARGGFGNQNYGGQTDGRQSSDRDNDRGFFERAGDEIRSWFSDDDRGQSREHAEFRGQASGGQASGRQASDRHTPGRGRGPKDYKRSDERIKEDVCDRLTDDWMLDASHIEVDVREGEVILNGSVNNRSAKRRAEDCAEDLSGVKHVQNNLRVESVDSSSNSNSNATMGSGSAIGQSSSSGSGSPIGSGTSADQMGTTSTTKTTTKA